MLKKICLLSFFSGVLISFSYIPFPPFLGFLALIPLWLAWDKCQNYKQVLWSGWIAQFFIGVIGFHWVAVTAHDFGYMPWPVSVIILVLFSSLMHIHFCIAGAIWFYLKNKFPLSNWQSDLLKLSCLFALQSYWPMIFPWNFGYSWMQSSLDIKQTAEIWGFVGIGFLVMLANLVIRQMFTDLFHKNYKSTSKAIFGLILMFGALNFLGYNLKSSLLNLDKSINALVIQANIGNFEKIQSEYGYRFQEQILKEYVELTNKGLKENPNIDFIVWPETAIPLTVNTLNSKDPLYSYLISSIRSWNKPVLSGTFLSEGDFFNGAVLFNGSGEIIQSYKKNHLLAFGETVPLTGNFPKLQAWLKSKIPALSFFGRGTTQEPFQYKGVQIGVNICYEGIVPNFIAKQKNLGAQILVNLTNDSWFGEHFEPFQHMFMTLGRAIENRIPVIRSTNTGFTTAIQADGTKLISSPINEKWFGVFSLKYSSEPSTTLYQIFHAYIPPFLILLSLFFSLGRKSIKRNTP